MRPLTPRRRWLRGPATTEIASPQDDRAAALRAAGAEVVVGDLHERADVYRVVSGCRRVYFGMSVPAGYLEATVTMAAVAREVGVDALVNMSQMREVLEEQRSPRRRGRLHHRRPGGDDGTGASDRSTARRRWISHPPRTPHNARGLGPETGRMLSTYIVETGQPIATFVDQPVQR